MYKQRDSQRVMQSFKGECERRRTGESKEGKEGFHLETDMEAEADSGICLGRSAVSSDFQLYSRV